MAVRKLKPIEDRDPYAASVMAAFDALEASEAPPAQPEKCDHVMESTGMYEPFDMACQKCGSFCSRIGD